MRPIYLNKNNNTVQTRVILPGSKSISNRLLVLQAISGQQFPIENLSTAADTRLVQFYLKWIDLCSSTAIPLVIDAENAGTAMRFLTAYLSITEGNWLLTGSDRMKKRPIAQLVNVLSQMGAHIEYVGQSGFPPLRISGSELKSKKLTIDASESSQFVTALMLIAPYLDGGLQIDFTGKAVSFPYILMTQKLMQEFGAKVNINQKSIAIKPGNYQTKPFNVEADWSAASYWYELVALSESADIFIEGLFRNSVQGDRVVVELFEELGVQTYFEEKGIRLKKTTSASSFKYDFTSCPDLVPAVIATCAGNKIPAELTGISHLKYKESDRIASLQKELLKTGTVLKSENNTVKLIPTNAIMEDLQCIFDTYADHRIAMALAPLVLKLESVKINNPQVVDKSYPQFWGDLTQSGINSKH